MTRNRRAENSLRTLRVATEQTCPHVRSDGTPERVTTCNFFTLDRDGRFSRVIIWIDGISPLK